MSLPLPAPKILRNEQNFQFCYETPHRIRDFAVYPTPSPNGSTITIYGHETGVRITWSGGRQFKPAAATEEKSKSNGAKTDSIMIIDSDDDDPTSGPPFQDNPDFVEHEERTQPGMPCLPIIQQLDLNFGAAALHIAVPPVSTSTADVASGLHPALLIDQLVFAVACSDQKVRVITRPLNPPSPESKARQDIRSSFTAAYAGNGKWGETVLELTSSSTPPNGVSMSFTNVQAERLSQLSGEADNRRITSTASSKHSQVKWHILIASHSWESAGVLMIYHIPIISTRKSGKANHAISTTIPVASEKVSLSSPATKIVFNPNISSPSQSSHLLIVEISGACRIFACNKANSSGSIPAENLNPVPSTPHQGIWLLSMYPGFVNSRPEVTNIPLGASIGNIGRKSILDAKWAASGKAVIVLLGDGEWGLWDIEGTGFSAGSKSVLGRHSIKGGSLTAFSVSGWVDSAPVKSSSTQGPSGQTSTSKFAPMTPGIRRTADPVLFSGRSSQGFAQGNISIVRLPAPLTTSLAEECVVFRLDDSYSVLPNLRTYWESHARRDGSSSGNLFGAKSSTTRLIRLDGVDLRGEQCCGIAQYLCDNGTPKALLPTEIIVVGEHRYVVVIDGTARARGTKGKMAPQSEFQLTAPRELDIMEIDEELSQMEHSGSFGSKKRNVSSPEY